MLQLINKNTKIVEALNIGWRYMVLLADVSKIKDGEVVCVAAKNPPMIANPENWDGILISKKPLFGDFGIDNKRNVYYYVNNSWVSITAKNV